MERRKNGRKWKGKQCVCWGGWGEGVGVKNPIRPPVEKSLLLPKELSSPCLCANC